MSSTALARRSRYGIRNWEDLRYILAVAREGSYSGAARKLRKEHSTVRRRVEAAQSSLGFQLFQRSNRTMRLTPEASRIIERLNSVDSLIDDIERRFAGVDERFAGPVKISTSDGFASNWLVPRMVRFQRENPMIAVEVDSNPRVVDVRSDEADIAIRFVRPTGATNVAVRVGRLRFFLFASRAYLNTFGTRGKLDTGDPRD